MGKRNRKGVVKRGKDEDMEPTEEELKIYPEFADKRQKIGGWENALDNEAIFGEDQLEGFLGLEVFHGSYAEFKKNDTKEDDKAVKPSNNSESGDVSNNVDMEEDKELLGDSEASEMSLDGGDEESEVEQEHPEEKPEEKPEESSRKKPEKINKDLKRQEQHKEELREIAGTDAAELLYSKVGWKHFELHPQLLSNLVSMNCLKPTLIQELALTTAFQGRDVLGAAPTGSGKTLAFAVPLVDWLMKEKRGGESESWNLRCVIISPTRELAMQTTRVLIRLCEGTKIQVASLIGGLAIPKQERYLLHQPEIVVGTPGRIWYFMEEKKIPASCIHHIRFVVTDEVDRLIAPGAYPEVPQIVEYIASEMTVPKDKEQRCQSLFFSATLNVNNNKQQSAVLKKLMKTIGRRGNPEIIASGNPSETDEKDETTSVLPIGLELRSVMLGGDREKEEFLYYFSKQFEGHTLVFFNSIRVIKRVYTILSTLKIQVHKIYSGMPQSQRIKHLNNFKKQKGGVLLATDVAARGLDIPSVTTVIHYHLPPTPTIFIHRSGRTARGGGKGLSLAFVGNQEKQLYATITKSVGYPRGFSHFPLGVSTSALIKDCVKQAREISEIVTATTKTDREEDWLRKSAQEADIDMEEEDRVQLSNADKKKIRAMKQTLEAMLSKPVTGVSYTGSYITSDPKMLEALRRGNSLDNKKDPLDECL